MYRHFFKRLIDIILSFVGLIVLTPVWIIFFVWIKLDSKGSILFTQDRVGQNKKIFKIHKYRTMKITTPKDTPTHLLENPEQYITRAGKFMRKTSIDELPQIWDIFIGKMTIIGPRPALWNQDDLIAERDKYKDKNGKTVNDLKPGLTGWAQINGRDELEIEVKAALDGEYLEKISLWMDIKCFFGTILSVLKTDGVVEGGTGELAKAEAVMADVEEDIEETAEMVN